MTGNARGLGTVPRHHPRQALQTTVSVLKDRIAAFEAQARPGRLDRLPAR